MRKMFFGCLLLSLALAYLIMSFLSDPVKYIGMVLIFLNPDMLPGP